MDILTSLHCCQCRRRNDWQGFWLCSLTFLQAVVFLPGSGGVRISVECTRSHHMLFFPEKEWRPRIVPIFCLSKISQRLEVVSLLAVAMLFQCLGGKTEHWTMFWKEESQQRWATGSREHDNYQDFLTCQNNNKKKHWDSPSENNTGRSLEILSLVRIHRDTYFLNSPDNSHVHQNLKITNWGGQNDWGGKGPCHQAWTLEFNHWDPHG